MTECGEDRGASIANDGPQAVAHPPLSMTSEIGIALTSLWRPSQKIRLLRCHPERSCFLTREEAGSRRTPTPSCALTQPDFDCALEPGLGGNRAQLLFFFAGCFVQRDRLGFDCPLLTEGVE